jgi:hypothetical protein
MRLAIVGIGEMFNLESGQMEDTLQVATPAGVISVPTTNEAAQALIAAAMGNGSTLHVEQTERGFMPSPQQGMGIINTRAASELPMYQDNMVTPGITMQERYATTQADLPQPIDDLEYPEGASVFGGDASVARLEGEPMGLADTDPVIAAKAAKAVQQAKAKLGVKRNNADRSGVPSIGISRVNAMGHPDLPPPPDDTMDDEEDAGEQI